MFLQHTDQQ